MLSWMLKKNPTASANFEKIPPHNSFHCVQTGIPGKHHIFALIDCGEKLQPSCAVQVSLRIHFISLSLLEDFWGWWLGVVINKKLSRSNLGVIGLKCAEKKTNGSCWNLFLLILDLKRSKWELSKWLFPCADLGFVGLKGVGKKQMRVVLTNSGFAEVKMGVFRTIF